MSRIFDTTKAGKLLTLTLAALLLTGAIVEFYDVAWGSGAWLGEFAPLWFVLFLGFTAFCVALFLMIVVALWQPDLFSPILDKFIFFRGKMKSARWLFALAILVFPVYFLQYTAGGAIFQGFYIRLLLWAITALLFAALISTKDELIGWERFLAALLLTSGAFIVAVDLKDVNSYPFSLGWSEGNRIWDYSILFGRERYVYPADQGIYVFVDYGRQFIGGLPFLFPGVTIGVERFWVALTFILPYLFLGLISFRASAKEEKKIWLLAALWVFLFLKQGPIYPPLVLSAALVALAWRSPLWLAMLLTAGAGYLARSSRMSWVFAPAIWIVMLEFASASFTASKKDWNIWARSAALGVMGLVGAVVFPDYVLPQVRGILPSIQSAAPIIAVVPSISSAPAVQSAPLTGYRWIDTVIIMVAIQPLLWYRLLPNSTNDLGILIGLVIAIAPLVAILIHLLKKQIWKITRLQKLSTLLPSLVFLLIGLIASAKIGGGNNLHNMDMFLVTLAFMGALAWYNGGSGWLRNGRAIPAAMKIVIALFLILPALPFLLQLYPHNLGDQASRLLSLTDAPNEKALNMLPARNVVDSSLETIRREVALAKNTGEVLFMDQRQLLTFGYVKDVPLVVDYEKKVLINAALDANATYFASYYNDLARKRFSLIVTSPLRKTMQGYTSEFGEENDAWVEYVARPTLCYYQVKEKLVEVGVQLLVPREEPEDQPYCPQMEP